MHCTRLGSQVCNRHAAGAASSRRVLLPTSPQLPLRARWLPPQHRMNRRRRPNPPLPRATGSSGNGDDGGASGGGNSGGGGGEGGNGGGQGGWFLALLLGLLGVVAWVMHRRQETAEGKKRKAEATELSDSVERLRRLQREAFSELVTIRQRLDWLDPNPSPNPALGSAASSLASASAAVGGGGGGELFFDMQERLMAITSKARARLSAVLRVSGVAPLSLVPSQGRQRLLSRCCSASPVLRLEGEADLPEGRGVLQAEAAVWGPHRQEAQLTKVVVRSKLAPWLTLAASPLGGCGADMAPTLNPCDGVGLTDLTRRGSELHQRCGAGGADVAPSGSIDGCGVVGSAANGAEGCPGGSAGAALTAAVGDAIRATVGCFSTGRRRDLLMQLTSSSPHGLSAALLATHSSAASCPWPLRLLGGMTSPSPSSFPSPAAAITTFSTPSSGAPPPAAVPQRADNGPGIPPGDSAAAAGTTASSPACDDSSLSGGSDRTVVGISSGSGGGSSSTLRMGAAAALNIDDDYSLSGWVATQGGGSFSGGSGCGGFSPSWGLTLSSFPDFITGHSWVVSIGRAAYYSRAPAASASASSSSALSPSSSAATAVNGGGSEAAGKDARAAGAPFVAEVSVRYCLGEGMHLTPGMVYCRGPRGGGSLGLALLSEWQF